MSKLHRGWFILILIMLGVLACLGFGRFSFGAILPFMKTGLNLDYRETGLIASAIFLGYMVGATISGHFVIRYTAKKVILFSLLLIATGMFLSGKSGGFWSGYFSCLAIGLGSGGTYVPSLGLLARWFSRKRRGMAMGIAMGGAGLGMIFSGMLVPLLITLTNGEGWRLSWYMLTVGVLLITILHALFLKNDPKEAGCEAIGSWEDNKTAAETQAGPGAGNGGLRWEGAENENVYKNKRLWMIGSIYLLWGFSYLLFSTFLVDYLISDVGYEKEAAGRVFAVAGFTSIISGFVWGSVSDRLGRMPSLSMVFFLQSAMLFALGLSQNSALILLETIIYGLTLWGIPTVMNASVSDFIHPVQTTVAMGFITLFFSVGQFVSPVVTGFLVDATGQYLSAFLLSALITAVGGVGCVRLHFLQQRKSRDFNLIEREG